VRYHAFIFGKPVAKPTSEAIQPRRAMAHSRLLHSRLLYLLFTAAFLRLCLIAIALGLALLLLGYFQRVRRAFSYGYGRKNIGMFAILAFRRSLLCT
jgi:hypothetical protein